MDELLTLRAGPLSLVLAPVVGGGIARFDFGPHAVMRPYDGRSKRPVDLASFPLVPYVNRIRGGAFEFHGRTVRLEPNMEPDPSPLHGQGWLAPWTVVRSGEREAEMLFRHRAAEWPWTYEARQLFRLDGQGLTLDLSCTNLDERPMPCGLGQHPYFPCTSDTRLDTQVEFAWAIDEKVLPVAKVPAQGQFDLRDRRICGQVLDNGFGGWGGRARIESPGAPFSIEMSSSGARFFQVYAPADGGFFVAEPVSHANAALNEPEEEWAELGLQVLEPGETMNLTMRIDVLPAA